MIRCCVVGVLAGPAIGQPTQMPTVIYAKALQAGDTIAFVAPAKYLDRTRVAQAKQRLESLGYRVRVPDTLFRKQGFLAGSDDERAAELMAAFADPQIEAVFPGTGGYGTMRILDQLDYDVIRRHPKIFIGFSDITALHIAIHQRTGLITFHSPNPEFGLGTEADLSPFAAKWLWRALLGANSDGRPAQPNAAPFPTGYTIETQVRNGSESGDGEFFAGVPHPITLVTGRATGRLIGGNLSLVHALMGTPYEIETDGKILFLEDVGEAPYRVDRMLCTMRLAGKFDRVAGVILGQFTSRDDVPAWDDDASIDDVLRDYFARLSVPVLMQFPVGHVRANATLPVGATAELDAENQTLRILEEPTTQPATSAAK